MTNSNINTSAFVIHRDGKRFNNKTFTSYEQARKYAIKKVRADNNILVLGYPTLSQAGFSIKRKEG